MWSFLTHQFSASSHFLPTSVEYFQLMILENIWIDFCT